MSDKNLIIDRGLLSAFAFNGDINSKPVFETLINLGVFFDAAIIVTVSNEERIKRIKKRNENDPDLGLDKIRNLRYDSMNQFILEHSELPCHTINTDNLTQEEVLDEALKYISSLKNSKKLVKSKQINKND